MPNPACPSDLVCQSTKKTKTNAAALRKLLIPEENSAGRERHPLNLDARLAPGKQMARATFNLATNKGNYLGRLCKWPRKISNRCVRIVREHWISVCGGIEQPAGPHSIDVQCVDLHKQISTAATAARRFAALKIADCPKPLLELRATPSRLPGPSEATKS